MFAKALHSGANMFDDVTVGVLFRNESNEFEEMEILRETADCEK